MIVRQHAARSLRRLIVNHLGSPVPRRCLATTSATQNAGSEALRPVEPQEERRARPRSFDAPVASHFADQHMRKTTGSFGTTVTAHYRPQTLLSNPPAPKDVTLELLLASQSHLGHATSLWNPANSRYIFGIRAGIHIISLDATAQHLRRAAKVLSSVTERGGLVLFVGTRPGFDTCVIKAAELAAPAYHLFERWTPGGITNAQQILGKCRVKVVDHFDRELDGFEETLLDRPALRPDLVVCLNPLENKILLHECALAGIPTVGIIDTDANPTWVTYPIPANDDSLRCVQVVAGVLGRAGQQGQQKRRSAAAQGRITYNRDISLNLPENFSLQSYLATNAPRGQNGSEIENTPHLSGAPTSDVTGADEFDARVGKTQSA